MAKIGEVLGSAAAIAKGMSVTFKEMMSPALTEDYPDKPPLPDSPLANSQNVGRVWEYETGAAIVYYPSSGVELTYGGTGVDYSGVPADDVQLIDGVRAIVRAADNPESFGFAQVMLPIPSGHLVTLLSKRPVSDLVSVAQTMRINGSQ